MIDGMGPMTPERVKITILVDNRAGDGLLAEHGFSLWVEADGRRILFDTGQAALEFNSRVLGVELAEADALVLSHGHYDHTGGIPVFLRATRAAGIHCHPGIALARYAIREGKAKSIGMPPEALAALEKLPAERLHPVDRAVMLSERVGLTGPIPRATGFEDTGGPFFLDPEGKAADPIEDDLALWIRTDEGLVVCAGCAHAGIVNTLDFVRGLSGERRIRAVLGGFHLKETRRERLDRTIAALRSTAPDLIVPCHCTGDQAASALKDALGERVTPGAAGMVLRF